jgi:hypothetical protein
MLLIDTEIGRIISDEELKAKIAAEHPYREWLNEYSLTLADLRKQMNPQARRQTMSKPH